MPDGERRRLAELNELAAGYCTEGRYAAAVPLFEYVFAGCTAGLGTDDPDTLISHGNLVVTQLRLDPCGPGLHGLDVNVAARARVFGDRHPATRTAREAQVVAYDRAAASAGPDHPDIVALRTQLTALRAEQPDTDRLPVAPGTEPTVPAPRRPRGARFPRALPDQRPAEHGPEAPAVPDPAPPGPEPAAAPRPRGARFHRPTD